MGSGIISEPSSLQTNVESNLEYNMQDELNFPSDSYIVPFGGFIENLGQVSNRDVEYYLVADTTSITFHNSKIQFRDCSTNSNFS